MTLIPSSINLFMVYLTTLSVDQDYIASNSRMKNELEMIQKETVVLYFVMLFQNSPEVTKENNKITQSETPVFEEI
jgi:hypothetical protein